jgi:hypothetical protein
MCLQQRGGDRLAAWPGPAQRLQRLAGAEEHNDRGEGGELAPVVHQDPEQSGDGKRSKRKQVNAADRRVALQRPADRRIADREPGKSGEQPFQRPLEQHPRRRDQQARAYRVRRRDARLKPAGRRGKQGKEGAVAHGEESGERRGHAAERVQADIHPRHAGAVQPEAEPEAAREALPRRRVHPQMAEEREGRDGKRKHADGSEGQNRRRAGEKRNQVFGLSTSRV